MNNRNLIDLNYQLNDNEHLLQKYNAQSSQLADIKHKWMNLQMQYQLLRIKYDQICSATDFNFNIGLSQKYKANFESIQWHKTVTQLKHHYENQIDHLKQKQKVNNFNRHENSINLKGLYQKIQSQQYQNHKKIQSLKNINLELTNKLQQKSKICKILMAKIYSLESSQVLKENIGNQNNRIKNSPQHLFQKYKNQQITNNSNIVQNQAFLTLKTTLLNQLVKDFFQIFLKSFDPDKKQPSITIFQSNINAVDTDKMKPFCQCLNILLSMIKIQQIPNKTDLNEKEKWVEGYLQSLIHQRDKRKKDKNSKLIYLLRLSGLYYRINSSNENEKQISFNLINQIKNQLFNAFNQFFFS